MHLSTFYRPVTLAVAAAVIGLSGCSDKPEKSALLQHVPADTPYVMDASKPLPSGLYDRLMGLSAAQAEQARVDLETAMEKVRQARAERSDAADPKAEQAMAMLEVLHALVLEVGDKLSRDGMAELGLSAESKSVFYGIGPFPVLRVEVADAAKLEATIGRIEARSGRHAEQIQADGYRYRYVALGPDAGVVIAIRDGQLVAGLLPSQSPELQALLLGDQMPKASLADSDTLPKLRKRYDYHGYMDGYVDLQALVAWFTGRGTGPAAQTVNKLMTQASKLEPGCQTLVDGLVAGMPRIAFGMPEADTEAYVVTAMHEASPAVGDYLKALAKPQPLPGMGVRHNGLASMGLDMDMAALRSGIKALGRYVAETGRDCSWVDSDALLAGLPKVDFALGPMLGGLSGFLLELTDLRIDPETQQPTGFDGGVLLAVQDPQGIIAMAGMLNPALGTLELPADGSAVAVPAGLVPPQMGELYLAGRDGLLALALGKDSAARTQSLLKAKRGEGPLWLTMDYDATRFAPVMAQLMRMSAAQMAAAGQAEQAEMMRDQAAGMEAGANVFGRVDMQLAPSADGMRLYQRIELE